MIKAILLFTFGLFAVLGRADTIKIAAVEYPPYYGSKLKDKGFISEIIKEAFTRSKITTKIKFVPWNRGLEGTKKGKFDALYTVWYRKDREEWFTFSDPLPPNTIGFFKRKDAKISYKNLKDLKQYKIGVVRGYSNPKGFKEAKLKTREVKNDEMNIDKLHKKRIDLALMDRALGQWVVNKKAETYGNTIEWLEPSIESTNQHIVFSKKSPKNKKFLEAFNAGLKAIKGDGTMKKILEKHGFGSLLDNPMAR